MSMVGLTGNLPHGNLATGYLATDLATSSQGAE